MDITIQAQVTDWHYKLFFNKGFSLHTSQDCEMTMQLQLFLQLFMQDKLEMHVSAFFTANVSLQLKKQSGEDNAIVLLV